jgi:hypothetical protein
MTLRKYAKGHLIEDEAGTVDKQAAAQPQKTWTAKDEAELREENQK